MQTTHGLYHDADIFIVTNLLKGGGEPIRVGQIGELPQIEDAFDLNTVPGLVGDGCAVALQHLRNAGADHAVA